MATELTVCVVNYNAADAVALALESFRHYHPGLSYHVFAYDNGSTDGAAEYLESRCDLVLHGKNTHSHGYCLTELMKQVETPYALSLDNDVEIHEPIFELMQTALDNVLGNGPVRYCVCPPRLYDFTGATADIYGEAWASQWSPDICVGLFDTELLHKILSDVTFGYYLDTDRKLFYETGGMVYRMAKAAGYQLVQLPALREKITHYGRVSTLWSGVSEADRPHIERRYECIQRSLQLLRQQAKTSG